MMTVGAVVVTHYPDLARISALLEALCDQVQIVCIVDNTPADDARIPDWCTTNDHSQAKVHLLAQGQNLGVARALNIGIEYVTAMGCSHVLLSDQDSLPAPGMVDALLAAEALVLAQGQRPGAVGPIFHNEVVGRSFRFRVSRGGWCRKAVPDDSRPILEVTSIITSGMLVRTKTIDEVGGMLDALFIDYVDIEWCQRARARGYRCFAVKNAVLQHRMGDDALRVWMFRWHSIAKYGPLRLYYQFRNSSYLFRLPYVDLSFKISQLWFWMGKLYAYAVFSNEKRRSLAMMVKGWKDGFAARLGPFLK